jgi:precorrin-6Y C5,15-methyltransferase (decarboxylating)
MFSDAELRLAKHRDPTPREIRALTLSALEPEKGGLLWDVGAGTGSIALEWIAARRGNRAIAVECVAEYVDLIRDNAGLLSEANSDPNALQVMQEDASEVLKNHATPDAIFLGCPSQVPAPFLDELYNRLPIGGRLVCNAIQQSSVDQVMTALRTHPGRGVVRRINLSTVRAVGFVLPVPTRHQLVLTKA